VPSATSSKRSGTPTRPSDRPDPVTAYALDVVQGRVLTGRAVRLAAQRHLDDQADGPARGLRWDADLAQRAIDFFPAVLRLAEGQHAGQPFRLEPWQQFVVGSLFGWQTADGTRRFHTAYIEAGKGSGKTPMAAGIGLYGLLEDGEAKAEVYAAATGRDQARILFLDAKRMVETSPALAKQIEALEHSLYHRPSGSVFRPVSSEARGLDGKRVHMALIDELHEHLDDQVVQKMRAGTKARRNWLLLEITNAGVQRESICYRHHEMSLRVLDGIATNDSWFAYVCQLDACEPCRTKGFTEPQEGCPACDDWRAEAVWPKTNPSLPTIPGLPYLRQRVAEAIDMPASTNEVRRFNFCVWTESLVRWFSADKWALGDTPVNPSALRGRRCIVGVDLSTTTDLTAMVAIFPDDDFAMMPPAEAEAGPLIQGNLDVLCWFFVPEVGVVARARVDRVPYDLWRDQGYLEATPGDTVDESRIRRVLRTLRDVHGFDVVTVNYDPSYARSFAQALQDEDGFTVEPITQSLPELNEPSMLLEKLVRMGRIRHGGHPVLRWCAANVVKDQDAQGRMRPSKGRSVERIDGIQALVIALRGITAAKGPASVYDTRGLLTV
jgi:phage terminase large subunit-like protein